MKELKIQNTLTGQKEVFKPILDNKVGMYVCGPTLYSEAHMGNVRTIISFDVIYRMLMSMGYQVRYVRNITDAGHLTNDQGEDVDRVGDAAKLSMLEPMELVKGFTNNFHYVTDLFNCLPPSIEPIASGHIIEIIECIQSMIEQGLAYEVNGSVYFDVNKYNEKFDGSYGILSKRKIDELIQESRELEAQGEKRNFIDFALWKSVGDDALQKWNSPWGQGGPGWHIECTAMSTKYLGNKFDIHGGGMDLKFPHHEAEIAQGKSCVSEFSVNYWIHTNMLTLNGAKMSKSKNNSITPLELVSGDNDIFEKGFDPMVIRFLMLQSHYSSTLDLSNEAILAAEKGFIRLKDSYLAIMSYDPSGLDDTHTVNDGEVEEIISTIEYRMLDDFNTSRSLSSVFDLVVVINKFLNEGLTLSKTAILNIQSTLKTYLIDVFGLKFDIQDNNLTNNLMELIIDIRAKARAEKNFEISDKIRDYLSSLNITIKDGKEKTTWVNDGEVEEIISTIEYRMLDDFNTSRSLSSVFDLVVVINKFLNEGLTLSKTAILNIQSTLKTYLIDVFGLKFDIQDNNLTNNLMELIIDIRAKARAEKNFEISDKIRDYLSSLNITIKDGKEKTTWGYN
ncbi:unnamed protein product [Cyprideis torosa]|uniref:Cysteine--tRNA ligase, cytoplasmic n=1 Tax=Cyprideis torosa TaxID=163714 RepID=A0A7R8WDC6_9CRUS|nr:unnamed protein product [Cyprideis torosa]CAG0894477.1 unnamed protein product [Cyprideis torosa]